MITLTEDFAEVFYTDEDQNAQILGLLELILISGARQYDALIQLIALSDIESATALLEQHKSNLYSYPMGD